MFLFPPFSFHISLSTSPSLLLLKVSLQVVLISVLLNYHVYQGSKISYNTKEKAPVRMYDRLLNLAYSARAEVT